MHLDFPSFPSIPYRWCFFNDEQNEKKNKAYTSIPQLRYVHIFERLASLKEARANCTADIKY